MLHLWDQYIKAEENVPADYIEEWGKIVDVLSGIREMIDNLPQMERPLCCECVGDGTCPIRKDE